MAPIQVCVDVDVAHADYMMMMPIHTLDHLFVCMLHARACIYACLSMVTAVCVACVRTHIYEISAHVVWPQVHLPSLAHTDTGPARHERVRQGHLALSYGVRGLAGGTRKAVDDYLTVRQLPREAHGFTVDALTDAQHPRGTWVVALP